MILTTKREQKSMKLRRVFTLVCGFQTADFKIFFSSITLKTHFNLVVSHSWKWSTSETTFWEHDYKTDDARILVTLLKWIH